MNRQVIVIACAGLYIAATAFASPYDDPKRRAEREKMLHDVFTLALTACPTARTAEEQRHPDIVGSFRLALDTPELGDKGDKIVVVGFYNLDRTGVVTVVMVNRAKSRSKVVFDHTASAEKREHEDTEQPPERDK